MTGEIRVRATLPIIEAYLEGDLFLGGVHFYGESGPLISNSEDFYELRDSSSEQ